MAEMTKEVIVASCKANGGYAAPHLNDQLYLHCKGFTAIKNLEPYRGVKVLWLEQNALSELSGLEAQQEGLVSLFVQNNFIRSLTSLTATLAGLRVLNVSHNYLTSLRGIAAACPSLETLQASHNQLTSLEACEELWRLAGSLTSVDLSFNRIETYQAATESPDATPAPVSPTGVYNDDDMHLVDSAGGAPVALVGDAAPVPVVSRTKGGGEDPLALVRFFQQLPLVSVVYMQGNGLSHRLRSYRRNMILHLPALTYLDERPVFPEERRVVQAWGRGGEVAESAERAAIREEKRAHLTQCVKVLTEQRDSQKAVRDRLTLQFEQRRAKELEELTQRRRRDRDNRAALESAEDAAREVVEKAEQDARWDLEDVYRAAHATLVASETAHRHAYERHIAVTHAAEDAAEEAAAEKQDDDDDDGMSQEQTEINTAAAVKVLEDAGNTAACADVFAQHHRHSDDNALLLSPLSSAVAGAAPSTKPSSTLAALLQADDDILKEMESEIEHVLYDLGSASAKIPPSLSSPSTSATTALHAVPSTRLAQETSAGETLPASYSSRQVTDRTTLRMERNVHAAVDHVASQLKAQQRRRSTGLERENMWKRFEQWELRRALLPTNQ